MPRQPPESNELALPLLTEGPSSDDTRFLMVRLQIKESDGQAHVEQIAIPTELFAQVFYFIREIGKNGAFQILDFYGQLTNAIAAVGVDPAAAPAEAWKLITDLNYPQVDQKKRDPHTSKESVQEQALAFTYALLRTGGIDYTRAAQYASKVTGQQFSTQAWRKRIGLWAERKKLPQIVQRKKRKR